MIWLQNSLIELGKGKEISTLYSDSQIAIHLTKNLTFHSRIKHIRKKYDFICDLLKDKELLPEKIQEKKNPTNMLTKIVTIDKMMFCIVSVGLEV